MGVRRVRDAVYWGVPAGTVIVPGMKPKRSAAGKMSARAAGPRPGSAAALFAAGAGKGRIHAATGGVHAPAKTVPATLPKPPAGPPHGKAPEAPRPSAKAATPRAPADPARAAEDARGAVQELVGTGKWASIADVRDRLASRGYSRAEQDAAFDALLDDPNVRIIPQANTKALTRREWDGGFDVAGETQHVIMLTKAPRPTPAPPAAAKAPKAATPRTARGVLDTARISDIAQRLRTAQSRDAAREALAGLTVAQLRQVAGNVGAAAPAKATKPRLVDLLAEIAGRRLDSIALSRRA